MTYLSLQSTCQTRLYPQLAQVKGVRAQNRRVEPPKSGQVWGPLLVYATSIIANNIIFEASLSYLGVGVPPPTPSWGQMLSDAVTSGMYQVDLSLALVPGIALVLTMLSFNLLGDGLHDALDPSATRR